MTSKHPNSRRKVIPKVRLAVWDRGAEGLMSFGLVSERISRRIVGFAKANTEATGLGGRGHQHGATGPEVTRSPV